MHFARRGSRRSQRKLVMTAFEFISVLCLLLNCLKRKRMKTTYSCIQRLRWLVLTLPPPLLCNKQMKWLLLNLFRGAQNDIRDSLNNRLYELNVFSKVYAKLFTRLGFKWKFLFHSSCCVPYLILFIYFWLFIPLFISLIHISPFIHLFIYWLKNFDPFCVFVCSKTCILWCVVLLQLLLA